MFGILLAVAVLATIILLPGCQFLPPRGPSICTPPELAAAAADAVNYWNRAGLQLDAPCTPGALRIEMVDEMIDGVLAGKTDVQAGVAPKIRIAREVLSRSHSFQANALAHELGHAMGLGHSPDSASVMYYINHALPVDVEPSDRKMADWLNSGGKY